MVALVVVLGQDLPVRRYLVVVAGGDDELLATVVSDQILQIARVFLERGRVAAGVGEEPPLPLHDALVAAPSGPPARPAQTQPRSKKCSCSHRNTDPAVYASAGRGAAAAEGV